MSQLFETNEAGARFSDCRKWRYSLWRVWGRIESPRMMMFLGMNPSIANEVRLDPTVSKMIRYAKRGGFDGLYVANVFAWVETDSRKLPTVIASGTDIIGQENDAAILEMGRRSGSIVCGCGNPSMLLGRWPTVKWMLLRAGLKPMAFGVNKNGTPVHPLYQRDDAPLLELVD